MIIGPNMAASVNLGLLFERSCRVPSKGFGVDIKQVES